MNGGVLSGLFKKFLAGTGDDIAAKVSSQYGDDVIRNLATSSADDIAAKQGNLIATHQLTADKLRGAADIGGFVQPSMAVVDPSKGTNFLPGSDFGDIVMVSNRNTIDPARKAAKAVIGDRDIYSPRFPETTYTINEAGLDDLVQRSGKSKQSALSNIDLNSDEPQYLGFMQDMYRKEVPSAADIHTFDLRDMPEFQKYAKEALDSVRGQKMLIHETPSGAKKQVPFSAENASKVMNKSKTVGGENGWHDPSTEAYHGNTTMFNSLDDLYKNRYRFVDSETGNETKSRLMSAVADMTNNDNIRLATGYPDELVADALSGGKFYDDVINGMHPNVRAQLDELRSVYQQVPTTYFEAKPRRVVGGNEFYGAYVPENAPQSVIDDLQRLGVTNVNRYLDAGDLDLSLAQLAKEGKRGISPYVLGLGGIVPAGGILGAMFSGNGNDQQPMA